MNSFSFKTISILLIVIISSILIKCVRMDIATKDKRSLIFPTNSGMGLIIAIALPIDTPKRNVFLSYTFEANYGVPAQSTHFTQGVLTRLDLAKSTTTSKNSEKRCIKNEYSLITRENIYKIIENKLNLEGFDGRACLLRTICETVEFPLNEHNGVLGNIFQILFTPSMSTYENINAEYYNAEKLGKVSKMRSELI